MVTRSPFESGAPQTWPPVVSLLAFQDFERLLMSAARRKRAEVTLKVRKGREDTQ